MHRTVIKISPVSCPIDFVLKGLKTILQYAFVCSD